MTTLLDQVEFDADGAAVGPGRFDLPPEHHTAQPLRDRVALRVRQSPVGLLATLYPVSGKAVRGIYPASDGTAPTLRLSAPFAAFLSKNLREPRPVPVCLELLGDDDGFESCGLFFVDGQLRWWQSFSQVKVTVAPGAGALTVSVVATVKGPARTAGDHAHEIFEDGARLSVSILVSQAHRFVILGAWPGEDGRHPGMELGHTAKSSLTRLDARAVLAGGGAVFGWSGEQVVCCWAASSRWFSLARVRGQRADGLFETEPQQHFHLDLTKHRVERLLRADRSANISLTDANGRLGYRCDYYGLAAADEGEHRRNVVELSGRIGLDASGLSIRLTARLSDYVKDTVRSFPVRTPSSKELTVARNWIAAAVTGLFDGRNS